MFEAIPLTVKKEDVAPVTGVHKLSPAGDDSHWIVMPLAIVNPFNCKLNGVLAHKVPEGPLMLPGVGIPTQLVIVNSQAPMSGVVALLGVPLISLVMPAIGVPRLSKAILVGIRLPTAAATNIGLSVTELASWPEAVCQFAKVV